MNGKIFVMTIETKSTQKAEELIMRGSLPPTVSSDAELLKQRVEARTQRRTHLPTHTTTHMQRLISIKTLPV